MRAPNSIVGTIATGFRSSRQRRLTFFILALLFGLLALFPTKYRAVTTLAPQNAGFTGIGNVIGALGSTYASLFGGQQPVETDLAVLRSVATRNAVIDRLHLLDNGSGRTAMLRRLARKVTIRALRAGIIEIAAEDHDPERAFALVNAYAAIGQARIAQLTRDQTTYKRDVIRDRLIDASNRLNRAQMIFDEFRRANGLADPAGQLGGTATSLTTLEGQVRSKEIDLATAQQFATKDSFEIKAIAAQLAALKEQIAQARSLQQQQKSMTGPSVGTAVAQSTQYLILYRNLQFSQGLYQAYLRFLEGTALEDLTADYNLRFLERPFLDPDIQFNTIPMALFIFVLLVALATEFYLTRPPVNVGRETS